MRIKTFEAPTMQEALTLARNEMGDEAVVLNTRHVKASGLKGLRGAAKVELMAAVDDSAQPAPSVSGPSACHSERSEESQRNGFHTAAVAPLAARAYAPPATATLAPESSDMAQLRSELSDLRSIVQGLLSYMPQTPSLDRPLILRLGVDEDIARSTLGELLPIDDPSALALALAGKMQGFAMPPLLDEQRVIAVVGPTGVGKTTTLAKLAARFALEQGKTVAMVTADTFRIGAVEQLRTYARIMGIPLEIALSPEEVAAGVEKHADKDVVLIDTVGRSQRSAEALTELKTFLDAAGPIETHLVISASLSSEIQREVVDAFAIFSPSRLIFTKLDESPTRGCLVNLPLRTGLGISCVTAGQNVPQDIDFADAGTIARLIVEVA